jgi:chalcone isomerase
MSAITAIQVENLEFPAVITSPATGKSYFLGGAGERGLTIEGNFIKFTAIGVYLEDVAVASLATKWKGKSSEELLETLDFYRDIISGMYIIKSLTSLTCNYLKDNGQN